LFVVTKRGFLLAAGLLLAACSDPSSTDKAAATGEAPAEKIQLPDPSGPHAIGVIDFELVDESRDETFAPGTARRIPVRAWYPAEAVSGEPRPYASALEMEHQVKASATGTPLPDEVVAAFDVPTHSFESAPVKALGPVPTVIFSHGLLSSLQRNTAQMEHLASHGYLVLSISHPYSAVATLHENGDVIAADPGLVSRIMAVWTDPDYMAAYVSKDPAVLLEAQLRNNETSEIARLFQTWQQDFIHVADRLESGNLPAQAQALLPLVDMQRLGAYGMSFGASGPAAAFSDPRFKAAVDLDGGMFDSALLDVESDFPMLVLHGDQSLMLPDQTVLPWSAFLFEKFATIGTRENVFRLEIPGAAHIAFTDLSLLPDAVRKAHPEVDAMLGSIDGQRMARIMNDFTLAFFDHYLSGQGAGLNSEFRAQFPEVRDVDVSFVRDWAATNPKPGFMSFTHVFIMNRLLAASDEVRSAAAGLDRAYSMVYQLENGPRGETVWWVMRFDPEAGVSFSLQQPEQPGDLTLKGDYAAYINFLKGMVAGEIPRDAEEPITTEGDPKLLEIVGAAFAASQKAATIASEFPDVAVSGQMNLPDGRTLSWTEYGDAKGVPTFYLHGAGSSHFEGAVFDAEAKAAGIRLIATNRPGVAGSSLAPNQQVVDYAADIAALADQLGIEKFVVAGMSNGGMFTMAVAHALPDRVIGAVPINASTPLFGDSEAYELSSPETRAAYEGMRDNLAFAVEYTLSPEGIAAIAGQIPAGVEPGVAAQFKRIREPVSQDGLLHEVQLGTQAWGFNHLDVQTPVVMFSGTEDPGFLYAKVWATKLPQAELKTFPGGHIAFLAPEARRDIMQAVKELGSQQGDSGSE
jgi:pimeloyl-ACP methyl ester carboxylesterase/predicted dienelactone hydrolase